MHGNLLAEAGRGDTTIGFSANTAVVFHPPQYGRTYMHLSGPSNYDTRDDIKIPSVRVSAHHTRPDDSVVLNSRRGRWRYPPKRRSV
jgi:hypothetical protein